MAPYVLGYRCGACGFEAPQWHARCPACDRLGGMGEQPAPGAPDPGRAGPMSRAQRLEDVAPDVGERRRTGFGPLDAVLGGGLWQPSNVLLAGDPGIGKSTLALYLACAMRGPQSRVLYVTAEQPSAAVRARAGQLGLADRARAVFVLWAPELEGILEELARLTPDVVLVDSLQALAADDIEGEPGQMAQVRGCAHRLIAWATAARAALVLLNHVTKDGTMAGPRAIAHWVDVVCTLEAPDPDAPRRRLRTAKNRFGPGGQAAEFDVGADGRWPW